MKTNLLHRIQARIDSEKGRFADWAFARFPEDYQYAKGVPSMSASIAKIKENGFQPGAIIDVGAYQGEWTKMVRGIYSATPIVMLEANPEKRSFLEDVSRLSGGITHYEIALLGPKPNDSVPYYVMETGSSVLSEQTTIPRSVKSLPMTTVDDVLRERKLSEPYFLKLDVQGYELEVLKGASRTLESTEVIVLEVSLMEYNAGAPLLDEVVASMSSKGFLAFDICGTFRRESDQALFMIDLMFVRSESQLRSKKAFWRSEASYAN
jgi:FkbM family methyltransferase